MSKFIDLTGKRFGRLEVLKRLENKKAKTGNQYARWECKCNCGNIRIYITSYLNRLGDRASCGCIGRELLSNVHRKHGLTNTRILKIWRGMKQRCYNSHHCGFSRYGGRGIIIADEWLGENGVKNFNDWAMNNGYREDLTIDRIDNDKGYSPDNCKWSTYKEQAMNTRNARIIEHNGEFFSINDLSKKYNISYYIIDKRLDKDLSFEEIIAKPIIKKASRQSGIKGIIWNKKQKMWTYKSIKNGKKDVYISEFKNLEDAIIFKKEYEKEFRSMET
jgi:hypothetical protein